MSTQTQTKQFNIQKQNVSVSQNSRNEQKSFSIRKKIAKHGENSIIVIPKLLQGELRPKMVVDIQIKVVEDMQEDA
jgi:hypothetical protein